MLYIQILIGAIPQAQPAVCRNKVSLILPHGAVNGNKENALGDNQIGIVGQADDFVYFVVLEHGDIFLFQFGVEIRPFTAFETVLSATSASDATSFMVGAEFAFFMLFTPSTIIYY